MVGVFIFPANPKDKDYKFKKLGRKILDYSDEELLREIRGVKGVEYHLHHKNTFDNTKDPQEIMKYILKYSSKDFTNIVKCKNGFTTEDKEYYVKIIQNTNEWFKQNFG